MDSQNFMGSDAMGAMPTRAPRGSLRGASGGVGRVGGRYPSLPPSAPQGMKIGRRAEEELHVGADGALRTGGATAAQNIGLGGAVSSVRLEQPEDKLDAKIHRRQKIEHLGNKVWNFELASGLVGGGLFGATKASQGGLTGFAARKRKTTVSTVLHAIFIAPMDALKQTQLKDITQFPANYMKSLNGHIADMGGTAARKWEASTAARAANLTTAGENAATKISNAARPVTGPVRGAVKSAVSAIENTQLGKGIQSNAQKFVSWRAEAAEAKYAKRLANAKKYLTHEAPGFFQKIGNFFTGKSPTVHAPHPVLAEVTTHLNNAHVANGTDRLTHFESAKKALQDIPEATIKADKTLKNRVGEVAKFIEKSAQSADRAHALGAVKAEGLSGMLKSVARSVGKTNLFAAAIVAGTAAGVSAIALTNKKQRLESKAAYKSLAQEIGADNAFMDVIDKAYHQQTKARRISNSLMTASTIANGAMVVTTGGAGAMMGMAFAPMLTPMLVKDNPLLNAYAVLQQADQGKLKLDTATKIQVVKQLVAAVPSVATNGGEYNRLTLPVAEAIVDRNLSAGETVRLIANNAKFSALASDVLAKQEQAKAELAANAPQAAKQEAPVVAMDTAQPSAKVANIQSHGRVAAMHSKAAAV